VEEIWRSFREIVFERINRFVAHKILRKNPEPEYYNKEVKRFRQRSEEYKTRENHAIVTSGTEKNIKTIAGSQKTAQETFLRSVLSNKDNCWSEFYKYVKRRKGNRENIPAVKDSNGTIITDSTEKVNVLNSYYASVFNYN
jgi:hypothetical protein